MGLSVFQTSIFPRLVKEKKVSANFVSNKESPNYALRSVVDFNWSGLNGTTFLFYVNKLVLYCLVYDGAIVGRFCDVSSNHTFHFSDCIEGRRIIEFLLLYSSETRLLKCISDLLENSSWAFDFKL
jgi:hypothetical protein